MLMLGREINQPAELVFSATREESPSLDPDTYVSQLASALGEVHQLARKKLQTTQCHMKRDYDLRIMSRKFEEGEMVYILDTASTVGKSKKLSPSWKGPGIITNKISNTLYEVRTRKTTSVHHHDRLKPCRDRVIPSWIQRFSKTRSSIEAQEDLNLDWLFSNPTNYCICNKPDDGKLMIGCDQCDQWFHGACVGISRKIAQTLDKYICPHCQTGRDNSP
ncbi:inhibitor of growth protein 4-like [Haliotis rubra]|uniref:inhibitor of growth protein 4-like n=1 Tax=Haliotis rubra TaxID=36100 RepID=UPI001EE60276|nr:inhibitor of growth protein 4-like [Haliotis rubra]